MKSINSMMLSLFLSFIGYFFSFHIHAAAPYFNPEEPILINLDFSYATACTEIGSKLVSPDASLLLSWLGNAWVDYALNTDDRIPYYETSDKSYCPVPQDTIDAINAEYFSRLFTATDREYKTGLILRAIANLKDEQLKRLKNLLYAFHNPQDHDDLLGRYLRSLEYAGFSLLAGAGENKHAGALFEVGSYYRAKEDYCKAIEYLKRSSEQNHIKADELYRKTLKELESNAYEISLETIIQRHVDLNDLSQLASSKKYIIFRDMKNEILIPKSIDILGDYINSPLERFLRFTLTMIANGKEIVFFACPFEFPEVSRSILQSKEINPYNCEKVLKEIYDEGFCRGDETCLDWYYNFEKKINNQHILHLTFGDGDLAVFNCMLMPEHCEVTYNSERTLNIKPVKISWLNITDNEREERKLFVKFQKECMEEVPHQVSTANSSDDDYQSFREYWREH